MLIILLYIIKARAIGRIPTVYPAVASETHLPYRGPQQGDLTGDLNKFAHFKLCTKAKNFARSEKSSRAKFLRSLVHLKVESTT